ncbi:hypothetical protein EJ02DRAFT_68015 [Clathrospora elynae]|uniref:Uncharacterized protein n=1 Tax=Clathrospora elynae TaxID=706981 RepID=A0A6A5SAU0_9PLEO|nr:hypothetical protein EJ02DRAFT_68015 [Clathrospora elynae]
MNFSILPIIVITALLTSTTITEISQDDVAVAMTVETCVQVICTFAPSFPIFSLLSRRRQMGRGLDVQDGKAWIYGRDFGKYSDYNDRCMCWFHTYAAVWELVFGEIDNVLAARSVYTFVC